MNAEQAWQSVLGQLQMEMPRASFDTWVRDTQMLSYDQATGEQAAVMTIGARNAYARDWLESRLASTVSRLLAGMMNQSIDVRFVVSDEPESFLEEDVEDEAPEEIAIEPVQFLDYEQIVQPHKQIVVKGYLRRLGMEIGAKAVWLYIGFHQAAWKAGSGKSSFPVRSREVLRYSGLSEGAFWRLLKHTEVRKNLAGLVERVDPQPTRLYQRGRDGRPHRAPVRYRVFLTPRLTISDSRALYTLMQIGVDNGQSLSDVLQALAASPDLLEQLSVPGKYISHFANLHTALDVTRAICGTETDDALRKTSQELHRKIVNSLGEIHIRHYFVEHIIPYYYNLTPAQAWLVTVARDMAYLNWRTGERRETILFRGGYEEMAQMIGLGRYKTIQEWFNPNWKAGKKGGDLSAFMTEIETTDSCPDGENRIASLPRRYKVNLDEPIADADGGIKLDANGGNTVDANGSNRWTPMEAIADANGGNMVDANGGVKNTLNTSSNTKKKTTSTTEHAEKSAGTGPAPSFWELKFLLQQNLVHPKVQRELLESQASVRAFVSWVLYACSPAAIRLSEPLGYALSQVRADPEQGAGDDYERFATLAPKDLLYLIDSTPVTNSQRYTKRSDSPLWPAWKATMGNMNPAVLIARKILFGKGVSEP